MQLFRRRTAEPTTWIFADEILSAVSEAECERLAELAQGSVVLELGSYYGRSTIALASTARAVHSVDPHEGGPPESPLTLMAFLENLERYGLRQKVVVHVGRSTEILPLIRQHSFDMVFIDAMHQRPEVDTDLLLAARCLRAGGCLAFHDYGRDGVQVGDTWHPFGVTEAVDEFAALAGVGQPEVVDSLAVVRSPAADTSLTKWLAGIEAFARGRG